MIVAAETSIALAGRSSSGGSFVIGVVDGVPPPPAAGVVGVAATRSESVTLPNVPLRRRRS